MRYALGIEYDGSDFFGWQRLSHGASLQGAVEKALSRVADHPVEVICSGRTDAGVHAVCQVVHFESHATRDVRAWMLGGNANLPSAIRILWAQPVAKEFHARYAARARRYRYTILNRMVQPALERFRAAWQRVPLDAERMHRAAQVLVGQHDFSAFRTVHCQAAHARRDLHHITVSREAEHVVMEVQANAFLHHMVRNIMGSLIPIGRGERDETWMQELLDGRDRSLAGPTAQPEGLVFLGPLYPAEWCLPAQVTQ